MKTESFDKFLETIDVDLGRDLDSLNLFEWEVEKRYDGILTQNKKIFSERPDMIGIYNEQILHELNVIMEHFIKTEDYEKCARIQKIQEEYKNII